MIENSKKMLHEIYCFKNLFRCKCGEVVDKKEIKLHNEEYHVEKKCEKCGEKYEKYSEEDHLKKCVKRSIKCAYCENLWPQDTYQEHIKLCGSKTEKCEKCGQYIMKKCKFDHEINGCDILVLNEKFAIAKQAEKPKEIPLKNPPHNLPKISEPQKSKIPSSTPPKTQEDLDKEMAEKLQNAEYSLETPTKSYKTEQLIPTVRIQPPVTRPYMSQKRKLPENMQKFSYEGNKRKKN